MSKVLIVFLLVFGVREVRQIYVYPSKEICHKEEVSCYIPEFTKENLKQYILDKRILHPEIVYAQAVLETGGFTSRIFLDNNNLFGMKLARKRRTLATGEQYGHACYNNWQESVDDYLLWQQQFKITPIHTERHYYRLLDRMYAEDPNYIKVVKIVRKRNDNLI